LGYWKNSDKKQSLKYIHSTDQKRLCELIRRVREEKGISQQMLAAKLDVPQSFISKIETGERRIDVLELRCLCKAIKIPLKDFVELLEEGLK
jgi:transcriptional regulator with XRE-family HTH domain